jgi:hypothetical protein
VLGLSYFTCVFIFSRPFIWYNDHHHLTFYLDILLYHRSKGEGVYCFTLMCLSIHLSVTKLSSQFSQQLFITEAWNCKTHSLNALLHWNLWWEKRNGASFETFGGALSDFVSLLVQCILCTDLQHSRFFFFFRHRVKHQRQVKLYLLSKQTNKVKLWKIIKFTNHVAEECLHLD